MEKRTRIAVLIVILVAGCFQEALAQDMNYSQYFSAPIYYNPAYTGINTGLRARFLYRNQWPSIPVSLKSYFFSADLGDRALPGAGGIGLVINQDTPGYGLINNFAASLTIGVRIPIQDGVWTQVGLKAGIMERRINWDELVYPSQLDPYRGIIGGNPYTTTDASKIIVPDFGCGVAIQFISPTEFVSGNFGVGIDHLFQPDVSFLSNGPAYYPRKWVGQFELTFNTESGGYSYSSRGGSDEGWKINLGAIYQNQASLGALQTGITLLKYNIYAGSWFKTTFGSNPNTALALVAGYKYYFFNNMSLRAMYSYDIQISKSLQGTGGAHEISLVIDLADIVLFGSSFGGSRGGSGFPGGRGSGPGAMECPAFY